MFSWAQGLNAMCYWSVLWFGCTVPLPQLIGKDRSARTHSHEFIHWWHAASMPNIHGFRWVSCRLIIYSAGSWQAASQPSAFLRACTMWSRDIVAAVLMPLRVHALVDCKIHLSKHTIFNGSFLITRITASAYLNSTHVQHCYLSLKHYHRKWMASVMRGHISWDLVPLSP